MRPQRIALQVEDWKPANGDQIETESGEPVNSHQPGTSQSQRQAILNKIPQIDNGIRSRIPPISQAERYHLVENILRDGCREPLIIWAEKGILLDGHNRYEICSAYDQPYEVVEVSFTCRADVEDWIDAQQLGRRNLTSDQMSLMQGRRYNRAKKRHGSEPGGRGNQYMVKAQFDTLPTAERLAEEHKVSASTIKRDGKIAEFLDDYPEEAQAVLYGTRRLADVRREIKSKEREIRISEIAQNKSNSNVLNAVLPDLILAGPPWRRKGPNFPSRSEENHYATLEVTEMEGHLPETELNCLLLLWATAPLLRDALQLIDLWGFTYKTQAVWDKKKIGLGFWFRNQHELLLVSTQGVVHPPINDLRVSSVFEEVRREHSRKPECVFEWIERTFPEMTKMEMYARRPRPGWITWGNEIQQTPFGRKEDCSGGLAKNGSPHIKTNQRPVRVRIKPRRVELIGSTV